MHGYEQAQVETIGETLSDVDLHLLTQCDVSVPAPAGYAGHWASLPVLDEQLSKLLAGNVPRKTGEKIAAHVRGYMDVLKTTLRKIDADPSDVVFVPSPEAIDVTAITRFLENGCPADLPTFKLRLLSQETLAPLASETVISLRRLCNAGKLEVFTSSAELAAHVERDFLVPVKASLLIAGPIRPGGETGRISGNSSSGSRNIFTVGIPGRQAEEKGSYRIPSIMSHLRTLITQNDIKHKFYFVCQTVPGRQTRRLVSELQSWLAARREHGVTIKYLPCGLPPEEYRKMIGGLDMMLLPHSTRSYRHTGSGLVVDGVLAGKPIVHSKGIALQGLLAQGNAEHAESDREFAEKILRISSGYEAYRCNAYEAAGQVNDLLQRSLMTLTADAEQQPSHTLTCPARH